MTLRFLAHLRLPAAALFATCLLAACGGGGNGNQPDAVAAGAGPAMQQAQATGRVAAAPVSSSDTLEVGVRIAGFPHPIDIYRPAHATRAIVFLHGRGGRNWLLAYDLGLNLRRAPPAASKIDWDWLRSHGVIAVFPQGQTGSGTGMPVPVWSNYLTDSGQDDVAFLAALAGHLRAAYGAASVALAGHSNGGAMAARVWCEATPTFDGYVTLSAAMPSATYPVPAPTCTPLAPVRYEAVIGSADETLQQFMPGAAPPTEQEMAAGLTNPALVAEWHRDADRSLAVCGSTTMLDAAQASAAGPVWSDCDEMVRYRVIEGASHPIGSLQAHAGARMVDEIEAFTR